MIVNSRFRPIWGFLLGLALVVTASPARAQQPSANAIAIATEIITVKGSAHMYDSVVPNIIEQAKGLFLQTNPMLGKDLNEVAAKLRAEYASRTAALLSDSAKIYASRFTERELKDALAFYKTPLGRKIISEEPKIIDESTNHVRAWGNRFSEEVIGKMRAEMRKRGHDL